MKIYIYITIKILLKFVPKIQIDNLPSLVQAIDWINDGSLTDAYMRHLASMS